MSRPDLLALTSDDLATLANRGLVKRAQKEVERGEPAGEVVLEPDGTLRAAWSDGVTCALPPARALAQEQCTCAAATVCRHLVRTVLAYQATAQRAPQPASETEATAEPAPSAAAPLSAWDPGTIEHAALAAAFRPTALARARARHEEGLTAELVRGRKPSAHLLELACTVRFLAPGSVELTHCDCADPAPCPHVPLAVWAFRLLAPEAESGLVATARAEPDPAERARASELEQAVATLLREGLAASPWAAADRFGRLEARCRRRGWLWPAEVLAELALAVRRYEARDARFDAAHLAELTGELLMRLDAIAAAGALPPSYVRGSGAAGVTPRGGLSQLVGLGCGVVVRPRGVELRAYLQDQDSGAVLAIVHEEPDPPHGPGRAFPELARRQACPGASFAELGARRLALQGGKRGPDQRLTVGRARARLTPQAFAWETLREPLRSEGFAELRARLAALPPAALRPRRVAEDLVVCQVVAAREAGFDPRDQATVAELVDGEGESATLYHPFTSRGREGTALLLERLVARGEALRFVAARARLDRGGLRLEPVALVFEEPAGRTLLQPWVDRLPANAASAASTSAERGADAQGPLATWRGELVLALGELLLSGLGRAGPAVAARWRALTREGEALGLDRLATRVEALAAALERAAGRLDDAPTAEAARAAATLLVLARLAQDLPA